LESGVKVGFSSLPAVHFGFDHFARALGLSFDEQRFEVVASLQTFAQLAPRPPNVIGAGLVKPLVKLFNLARAFRSRAPLANPRESARCRIRATCAPRVRIALAAPAAT
jgi:hypothetical protein